MRTYEALIIVAETVKEDKMNEAMDAFQAEVERQGGRELNRIVLGRRVFARPLKNRESGLYAKMFFEMEPDKIAALKQRCKFADLLFRIQILALPKGYQPPVSETDTAEETPAEAKAEAEAEADAVATAKPAKEEITDGLNE